MVLLTDCDDCLRLKQKVVVLEERISLLYSIHEDERLLDSLYEASKIQMDPTDSKITEAPEPVDPAPSPLLLEASACPTLPAAREAADSIDSEVIVGSVAAPLTSEVLEDTVPCENHGKRWNSEGAKPKRPSASSTPGPWSLVCRGKHWGNPQPRPHQPAAPLATRNPFSVLAEDFPCLPSSEVVPQSTFTPPTAVSAQPSARKTNERRQLIRSAVRQHSGCPFLPERAEEVSQPGPCRPVGPTASASDSKRQSPSLPSTIILGDSIVRNVSINEAHTVAFPGATVAVITDQIQDVVMSFPAADSLVLHVGTNDISRRQSESLKRDFIQLFGVLKHLHLDVSISGPTPTFGRGCERFSRLLYLNTWLRSACQEHNVHFIDNFNLFWWRSDLFRNDGLHLNFAGANVLSMNLAYSLLYRHAIPSTPSGY